MTSIACCSGFIDEGTPRGKEDVYNKIPCYVASPKTGVRHPRIAIVVATDVFGFKLPNTRLIADSYADEGGVLTVVPDLFEGKELPADLLDSLNSLSAPVSVFRKIYSFFRVVWYVIPFLSRASPADGVQRIEKVIQFLKANQNIERIAVMGYCWGGRIVVNLGHKEGVVDVVGSAHPGGLTLPKDVDLLKVPSYFILPEKDMEIKEKQVQLIRSSLKQKDEEKQTAENLLSIVKFYPNMEHGFAVRGNEKDPEVKKARQDAFQTSLEFFKRVLQF